MGKRYFPDMLDAQEYGELYWESMEGAGRQYGDPSWYHPQYGTGPEPVIPEYILAGNVGGTTLESIRDSDPTLFNSLTDPENYNFESHQIIKSGNTDRFDELYNPAPMQNIQISMSGGSENALFAVTANYFDRKNISYQYSYFRKYSVRANSSLKLSFLRFGENMQFSFREGRIAGSGNAWEMPAISPVYDIDGNPAGTRPPGIVGTSGSNPVADAWRKRFDRDSYHTVQGNVYAEVTFLKDFVFRSSYGISYYTDLSKDFTLATVKNQVNIMTNGLKRYYNTNNRKIFTNTQGIDKLRIYVQAENLWTWVKEFSGIDPAMSLSGNSLSLGVYYGTTPVPQQLVFGVDLGL